MAARGGKGRKAAGWAISLGVHLLFLAMILLAPTRRLANPPAIEVRMMPPPEFFSEFQPDAEAAPAAQPMATAPAERPFVPATAKSGLPTASPTALTAASTTTGPAQSPLQPAAVGPPSAAPRAAGSPAPGANGLNQAAVNALRQSFGCSSGMRQILTVKEQADCEQRAAERDKDLPDRAGDTIPKYKRDYYDAVVAVKNGSNHIPGTDCTLNAQLVDGRGGVGVSIDILRPITCVPLPGAGPKPAEPTLKDLGLAR